MVFRKIILLCSILSIMACQEEKKEGYTINASMDRKGSGKMLKVFRMENRKSVVLDSARINNGKVSFEGIVESPDLYYISVDGQKGNVPLMVENEDITLEIHLDSLHTSIVTGSSKENEIFKAFKDISIPLRKQNEALGKRFKEAQGNGDKVAMDSIKTVYDALVKKNQEINLEYMEKYNDAVISSIILLDFHKAKTVTYQEVNTLFNNFTDDVKQSRSGKELKVFLDATKASVSNVGLV